MVGELGAALDQPRKQRALRSRRHAVGADQGGAAQAQAIGSNGHQIGVLAHVDGAACHCQARRGAQQPAQRGVGRLACRAGECPAAFRGQVEKQGRTRELVHQHAGPCPQGAVVLLEWISIRRPGWARLPLGLRCHVRNVRGQPFLPQDGKDEGAHRLAAVERVRVAQSLGSELGARLSVHRQPQQHEICATA